VSARHELEGELATCYLYDVVGVSFAGESEAAIFLPYSGEVLLCSASAWREVCASRVPVAIAMGIAPPYDGLAPTISGQEELTAALTRLGARID